MSDKGKLNFLIKKILAGDCSTSDFCNDFTIQYGRDTDYNFLSENENMCYKDLSEMTARFSDIEEDLKIPNMYYNEEKILAKAVEVSKLLSIS
jgi:hypothetical protein